MARGSITKRVLDDGSSRYDVIVDLGIDPITGKRRQRKKTFTAKKAAQAALTAWQAEIDNGTAVDCSRQTVAELLRFWLETYAHYNVRPATLDGYEYTIVQHIIPILGSVPIQKLTPDQLQCFYSTKLAAGCGARTVQLCHLRLSQALDYALKLGLVARNVADAVTPPRVRQREMTTWTATQARQFLVAAARSAYGPIWTLSLATGMRRGELLGLRWQDVDWERGVLTVRQTVTPLKGAPHIGPPKSKSAYRSIAIPDAVMLALREWKSRQNEHRRALGDVWEDHDLVFAAANGRPINPNNLTRDYERWVQVAGVPRIRIHDQRHTHVSLAIQMGANIKAVSQRVGHARTSTTMDIYAHVVSEQHKDVADKIGGALFAPSPSDTPGQSCDKSVTCEGGE